MENRKKIKLILENGAEFKGYAFGHTKGTVVGDVIFTTGAAGYQETFTDNALAGKIVCMTYPLIGNSGINLEDMESDNPPLISGLVISQKCDYPNNWRCEMNLDGYLKQNKINGIEGIDTRALARMIRDNGTMKGVITEDMDVNAKAFQKEFAGFDSSVYAERAYCKNRYVIEGRGIHIAVVDFGSKKSSLEALSKRGCKLTIFPPYSAPDEILSVNPDGILLSSGTGNPEKMKEIVENVKILSDSKPMMGIGIGHIILSAAMGCEITKMKFGHHGGNHGVKNTEKDKCYIVSQNHDYVVRKLSEDTEANWINVNDKSIEGVKHKKRPLMGTAFYPDLNSTDLETGFIFDEFIKASEEGVVLNA